MLQMNSKEMKNVYGGMGYIFNFLEPGNVVYWYGHEDLGRGVVVANATKCCAVRFFAPTAAAIAVVPSEELRSVDL